MTDQVKQTVITQKDINDDRYIFGPDVITRHQTGVSKTRAESAKAKAEGQGAESDFTARFHYKGSTLAQVQKAADYENGVKLRASLRGNNSRPAWIPPKGTIVDVFMTNGCKVQIADLPAEAQAQMLFGGIEDPDTRKKAIRAFLAAL